MDTLLLMARLLLAGVFGPRVNASAACKGSNRPVMPSDSCQHSVRSFNIFARGGICCRHTSIATR